MTTLYLMLIARSLDPLIFNRLVGPFSGDAPGPLGMVAICAVPLVVGLRMAFGKSEPGLPSLLLLILDLVLLAKWFLRSLLF
jgi:hypothetical protein